MKKSLVLNPAVAYREKNGVYVFYYDFSYIFFTGAAAKLMNQLFATLKEGQSFKTLPDLFLNYLVSRKIILEE